MNVVKGLIVLGVIAIIVVSALALLVWNKPTSPANSPTTSTPTSSSSVGPELRIVSITPSDTQILIALGLGKYVVGVDKYSYQLLEEYNMTYLLPHNVTILGSIRPPNITGILLLKPTVVVAEKGLVGPYVDDMKNAGLNVLLTENDYAPNFTAIEKGIIELGQYFNRTKQAEELVAWMNQMISNFSSPQRNVTTVAYLLAIYNDYSFYTVGGNVFPNDIIRLAGGVNVFANYTKYPKLQAESLLIAKPQVIIAYNTQKAPLNSPEYTLQALKSFPEGSEIPALRDGNYYVLDHAAASLLNQPGPLAVFGIKLVSMIINGQAPHVINATWVKANLHPTIPVFS